MNQNRKRQGQKPPTLAQHIKRLLRRYPKGIGIIKELLQNADDAKASELVITLDRRSHRHQGIKTPREGMQGALLGPAILAYNDKPFTDEDLDNIENIENSSSQEKLWRTGRFGQGFNSVYHVTDYPSFVSQDWLYLFDPLRHVIESDDGSGDIYYFVEEDWWQKYPDFMALYTVGGLTPNIKLFNGTIFRLPLRRQPSELCEDFKEQSFDEMVQDLYEFGDSILLFLKYIQTIKIQEICEGDTEPTECLSIAITNSDDVQSERNRLLSLVAECHGDNWTDAVKTKEFPVLSYRQDIHTKCGGNEQHSSWRVCNRVYFDQQNSLLQQVQAMQNHGEKAIPWAGAATRILSPNEPSPLQPEKGRAYCFLPLPIETAWSLHVHGYFDLDEGRRKITGEAEGEDKIRGTWNRLLAEKVLALACTQVIQDLVTDIKAVLASLDDSSDRNALQNTILQGYYQLWLPLNTVSVDVFKTIPKIVAKKLYEQPVIHTASGWKSGGRVCCFKSAEKNWHCKLLAPLQAEGEPIPDPELPENIIQIFEGVKCNINYYSPEILRGKLRCNTDNADLGQQGLSLEKAAAKLNHPCLAQRNWVVAMLQYCIKDGHKDLTGLPLAILSNQRLKCFGADIWIAEAPVRLIFRDYPEWFLDPQFLKEVNGGNWYQDKSGMKVISAEQVIYQLQFVFKKHLVQSGDSWQDQATMKAEATKIPNADWLALIYEYLSDDWKASESERARTRLQGYPLVPQNDGCLHSVCNPNRLSIYCQSNTDPELLKAFAEFNIAYTKVAGKLDQAIHKFVQKNPDVLVFKLTPDNIARQLDLGAKAGEALDTINQKRPCFSQSLTSIYQYFAQNNKTNSIAKNLLLPGSDGKLYQHSESGPLWNSPKSRIDPETLEALKAFGIVVLEAPDLSMQKAIDDLLAKYDEKLAKPISTCSVVSRLQIRVPQESSRSEEAGKPNQQFCCNLAKVYQYLTRGYSQIRDLLPLLMEQLPVPINTGIFACPGKTAIYNCHGESDDFQNALEHFGITALACDDQELQQAIQDFIQHCPGFLKPLTREDLANELSEKLSVGPGKQCSDEEQKHYHAVLDFLTPRLHGKQPYSPEVIQQLRGLPIYSTVAEPMTLIDLQDRQLFYTTGGEPPKVAGDIQLVSLGDDDRWRLLFKALGIQPADYASIILELLLPNYDQLDRTKQREVLEWIRLKWLEAEKNLHDRGDSDPHQVRQKLAQNSLVYCEGCDQPQPIAKLYDPDKKESIQKILGGVALFPDLGSTYADASEDWLQFFQAIGMRTEIVADDMTQRILELAKNGASSPESVAKASLAVLDYLTSGECDQKLLDDSSFVQAVQPIAWLPVASDCKLRDRYPTARSPERRLYKLSEVAADFDAALVASQRPILQRQRGNRPRLVKLGYQEVQFSAEIVPHFESLIRAWHQEEIKDSQVKGFVASLSAIYCYLASKQNDSKIRDEAKSKFGDQYCLWDNGTKLLWKPCHAFSGGASVFQSSKGHDDKAKKVYRVKIQPADPMIKAYELLGMRAKPSRQDYLDFLEEIKVQYSGSSITDPRDLDCVIKVLKKLSDTQADG